MSKQIVHIDMDDTICDYKPAYINALIKNPSVEYPQSVPGFFLDLEPIPGAIEAVKWLEQHHEVYITTRPSYINAHCYTEKRLWVEKYFGLETCRNLTLAPNKGLLIGDVLIDDFLWENFKGRQILFGSDRFPNWETVLKDF